MPFAVFRRHQRKLLAVFAILAMVAFVLDPSLFRFWNGSGGASADPVVVSLYGKQYRRSDLYDMITQRNNANRFIFELFSLIEPNRMPPPQFFGDISTRSMVDAIVLEHEADKLRMPRDKEVAKEWLRTRLRLGSLMNAELFELALSRLNTQSNRISGDAILRDVAGQVRIANARELLGAPVVTPLDVFDAYREVNEKVSARAVAFPVDEFVAKVKAPSASEVQAYYDRYKDILPDPDRDAPGFKIPRRIRVETLSIDGADLARKTKEKLTDSDLRTYYENHKGDYAVRSEFPEDIFANDPKGKYNPLPPLYRPFEQVKESVAIALADERSKAEIADRFTKVREDVLIPFAESYLEASDEIAEEKKEGKTPTKALPKPTDLKDIAAKEGFEYDKSPLLTREQAEHYGQVSEAEVGANPFSGGKKFAVEFFEPKSPLFEPMELTDARNRHYLVRKTEDLPPRVPPLEEIKEEVVHAWKIDQARPLAMKAAEALADQVKKEGGKLKADVVDGHPVITTDPASRSQLSFMQPEPTPTDLPQLPHAGTALRDALFGLKDGAVAVAPNEPKTTYYVLTLKNRVPAKLDTLYAPNGDYFLYQRLTLNNHYQKLVEQWMSELRADAGLPPGWVPPDEGKREPQEG
ncbi:MAG: hypothetical protein P4L84_19395 [Isosphaeraceae bacterium]|nr:hypothetical protein [Isosphaeraceae bacterium]